jgi:uncharacterized membrane protein YfcA
MGCPPNFPCVAEPAVCGGNANRRVAIGSGPEIVARHTYPVELDEHTGRFIWAVNTWLLFLMFGAVTGFMTGLLAVGGGFIIVPLLRQFTPFLFTVASQPR